MSSEKHLRLRVPDALTSATTGKTSMKFDYTCTRLNVQDYLACKQFYTEVMGFEVTFTDDDDEYTELNTGHTKITIFNRKGLKEFLPSTESLSYDRDYAGIALTFTVQNLNEAMDYLRSRGVEFMERSADYPARGFISACFRDPDGNLIELEQMLT